MCVEIRKRSSRASGDEVVIVLDTTLTGTISILEESHVSLLTPGVAPRVLHDPEVLAGGFVGAISDNEGGVIEISSTSTVEDTTLVQREICFRGINTNRDGLNSESLLHGGNTVRFRSTLRNDHHVGSLFLAVHASSFLFLVGVVRLGHTLGGTVHVVLESPEG
jgi:hypothetical protein